MSRPVERPGRRLAVAAPAAATAGPTDSTASRVVGLGPAGRRTGGRLGPGHAGGAGLVRSRAPIARVDDSDGCCRGQGAWLTGRGVSCPRPFRNRQGCLDNSVGKMVRRPASRHDVCGRPCSMQGARAASSHRLFEAKTISVLCQQAGVLAGGCVILQRPAMSRSKSKSPRA